MKRADLNVGRRQFMMAAAAAVTAPSVTTPSVVAQETSSTDNTRTNKICVFTKPFNSLSFDELADRMAEIGVDGIEAPVRKGGHVEPSEVEEKLPLLVEALQKRKLEITVMASDVNDPDDRLTERVLRTAATLGIKRYRMKYFKYDLSDSVLAQLDQWRPQIRDLAAMNHDFGIRGLYQNHAGRDYMGASLWDLRLALEGVPPEDLAVAYDIRHATAEAGMGWPATLNMIRPMIDTLYVKDFVWQPGESRPANVPLGEGRVDPKFIADFAPAERFQAWMFGC